MSKPKVGSPQFCDRCVRELDERGNCPKHWPEDLAKLADYRRQATVNRVAKRISPAEDLLAVLDAPIGPVVERLLDSLAGLTHATAAGHSNTLQEAKSRPQHAPMPKFQSAWAEHVQSQVNNQLWELSETIESFLNRPSDPKTWAACDTCGNRRIGDSTYCRTCGSRILAGAKRCRITGCPNEGKRRSECPRMLPSVSGLIPHPDA